MRLFGTERLINMFNSLGIEEGEQIEHKMLSSAVEKAQKKIENNNFGIRKNLLEYDRVNNEQREIIYAERRKVLEGANMRETIFKMINDVVEGCVDTCISDDQDAENWDLHELNSLLLPIVPIAPVRLTEDQKKHMRKKELVQQFLQKEEVADDFAAYYQLYCKYGEDYAIPEIVEGSVDSGEYEKRVAMASESSFEERFTVVGLVLACLAQRMEKQERTDSHLYQLHTALKYVKDSMEKKGGAQGMASYISFREDGLKVKIENEIASKKEIEEERWILARLKEYELILKKEHLSDNGQCFERVRQLFAKEVKERKSKVASLKEELERAFSFVKDCFGDDQEMVLFVSGLSRNESVMKFVGEHGCDSYFCYSEALLYRKQEEQLKKAIKEEMKND